MIRVLTIVASLFYSAQVPSPPSTTTAPAGRKLVQPDYLRYRQGYKPSPGRAYVTVGIPGPISEDAWSHYCEILVASEEQLQQFAVIYDRYRQHDWDFRLKETQPLWDQSADIAARGDLASNANTASVFNRMVEGRNKALPQLNAIENAFFTEVQLLLAEPQLLPLERVRKMRFRVRCGAIDSMYPASMIDLEIALRNLRKNGVDLTPRDPVAFDTLLLQYNDAVTPLVVNRFDSAKDSQGEIAMLYARARELTPVGDPPSARSQEVMNQIYELRKPTVAFARRIHDVNRQFATALAEQLSPEAGELFRKEFQEAAYPAIFPDPTDIEAVFTKVLAIQDLTADSRAALEDQQSICRNLRLAVQHEMIELYLDWREKTSIRQGYGFDAYEQFAARMRSFRAQSRAASDVAIMSVREQLSPDQLKTLTKELAAYDRLWTEKEPDKDKYVRQGHEWPGPLE